MRHHLGTETSMETAIVNVIAIMLATIGMTETENETETETATGTGTETETENERDHHTEAAELRRWLHLATCL